MSGDATQLAGVQSVDPRVHSAGYGAARYGGDEALYVEFGWHAVELGFQSAQLGRKIYEKRVYVRIICPGAVSTKNEIHREATDEDKQRFPRQWAAFNAGNATAQSGTPVEVWPLVDVAQVANLKAMGVFSVEQIAALSDTQIQPLAPHGFAMRDQARAWLKSAADGAVVTKQAKEMDDMRREISDLRAQMRGDAPPPVQKNKGGRPRKHAKRPPALEIIVESQSARADPAAA